MKKLLLAALLVTLGISAVFGWRHWHAVRAESAVVTTGTPADATTGTVGGTGASAGVIRGQSNSTALAATASAATSNRANAMPTTAVVQPQKRAWDYHYFASLSNAAPGAPIRFELDAGNFAAGTIQHAEHANGGLAYVSGVVTQPEQGRFFFQKQKLPGKQGDFAGVVEFPASKTAWRIEPSGGRQRWRRRELLGSTQEKPSRWERRGKAYRRN